ncbi:hypothetical protein MAHJHV57_51860 [Mycobacterium avium subsp. hominissuis]
MQTPRAHRKVVARESAGARAPLPAQRFVEDQAVALVVVDHGASFVSIVVGALDDAHERRAVVYDNKGNGLVFYKPLGR